MVSRNRFSLPISLFLLLKNNNTHHDKLGGKKPYMILGAVICSTIWLFFNQILYIWIHALRRGEKSHQPNSLIFFLTQSELKNVFYGIC